jgi:hypothetical protein
MQNCGRVGARSSARANHVYTRFRLLRFLFQCSADPIYTRATADELAAGVEDLGLNAFAESESHRRS